MPARVYLRDGDGEAVSFVEAIGRRKAPTGRADGAIGDEAKG